MKNIVLFMYVLMLGCSAQPRGGIVTISEPGGKVIFTSSQFLRLVVNETTGSVLIGLPDSDAARLEKATSGFIGVATVFLDAHEIAKIEIRAPANTSTLRLKANNISDFVRYLDEAGYSYTIDNNITMK